MSCTCHSSVPALRTGLTAQQPTGHWSQSYTYDAAKRLATLSSPAGTFSYTLGGSSAASLLPKKITLPNTAHITNVYDGVARLLSTRLNDSSHTTLNAHQYLYNAAHQRTRHTRTDGSYVSFTYDNLSQLLTAVGSGGQSTENLGYLYDSAWNLSVRTNNGAPTSFSVNVKNELTAVGGVNYFYDGDRNLSSTSDYRSYSYDDENQLPKDGCGARRTVDRQRQVDARTGDLQRSHRRFGGEELHFSHAHETMVRQIAWGRRIREAVEM